jgi:hypothetical protein
LEAKNTEFVVSELKSLVGWGAEPKTARLASLPWLKKLAGVTDDTPSVESAGMIRASIDEAIDSRSGSFDYQAGSYADRLIRTCLRLLMKLSVAGLTQDRVLINISVNGSAQRRRECVIKLLGICDDEEQIYYIAQRWRRPDSKEERDLLRILAVALVERSRQTAA